MVSRLIHDPVNGFYFYYFSYPAVYRVKQNECNYKIAILLHLVHFSAIWY